MLKGRESYLTHLLLISITLFIFASCNTSRNLASYEIKPMTASKIIRKVNKETPIYKNYESKRIAINYKDSENKNSLIGQFKIDKNKCIILTLKKMNLPIGRGLITSDSLIFVNYMHKNFIKDDISKIQNVFGFDIDYKLMQALLTADISNLLENEEFDKDLTSLIDENMYRIDSQLNNRINKALSTGNKKRLNRYMNKMDDSEFINYTVWIDPQFFVIRKLSFEDIKYKESLTILYDQYELVGHSLFPQKISVVFVNSKQKMEVDMDLSRPSVNKVKDFLFNVPEKYEKQNL